MDHAQPPQGPLVRLHAEAEQLFESILTRRLDKTAGMRAAGTRA